MTPDVCTAVQDLVYCIEDEQGWHRVLGSYHPDLEGLSSSPYILRSDIVPAYTAQRLCDQRLVSYNAVQTRVPSCEECLRIQNLMDEFATHYEDEEVTNGSAADDSADAHG